MRIFPAVIIAIALLSVEVGASPNSALASGRANNAEISAGGFSAVGLLNGAQWGSVDAETVVPFYLTAGELTLQTIVRHSEGNGPYASRVWYSEVADSFVGVTVQGGQSRLGNVLTLLAPATNLPDFAVQGTAAAIVSAANTSISFDQTSPDQQIPGQTRLSPLPSTVDVGPSLSLSTDGDIVVRGDFTLALYEWDAQLVSDEGLRNLETGVRVEARNGLPSEAEPLAWHQTRTQAILIVEEGELTVPREAGAVKLLVADGMFTLSGTLRLGAALGEIYQGGDAQPLQAEELTVSGDLALALKPADRALDFQLVAHGRPTIDSDGLAVAWTAAEPARGPWGFAGSLGFGLIGVVAFGFLGRWAVGQWADKRLERAERLLEMEEFAAARVAVQPLLRMPGHRSEAAVIEAEALLCQGQPERVLERLRDERAWRTAPALRDYMAARSHARLGQAKPAREALASMASASPDLLRQARRDPTLQNILRTLPEEGYV